MSAILMTIGVSALSAVAMIHTTGAGQRISSD